MPRFLAATQEAEVGIRRSHSGIYPKPGQLCHQFIKRLAPLFLLASEQFGEPLLWSDVVCLRMHDQMSNGVGVAVAEVEIRLKPSYHLSVIGQASLSGQKAKILRRPAGLGPDIVKICLISHDPPPAGYFFLLPDAS